MSPLRSLLVCQGVRYTHDAQLAQDLLEIWVTNAGRVQCFKYLGFGHKAKFDGLLLQRAGIFDFHGRPAVLGASLPHCTPIFYCNGAIVPRTLMVPN